MQFDPESAKSLYAQKETDELVRIAFLEEAYVDGAKNLAKEELARRGLNQVDQDTIERVRAEVEQQRIADLELQLQGLETEDEIPSWRQAIRLRLAPYRNLLSFLIIAVASLFMLNSTFGWELFNLGERRSEGIALLALTICFVLILPTRKEFIEKYFHKNGKRRS